MTVLITGGAGYIGAHAAHAALEEGRRVVVLDDLRTGVRGAVPDDAAFVHGDIADRALVERTLRDHRIDAVLHFAASTVASQSMAEPLAYWRNNLCGTVALLEACVAAGVRRFVFSSTAAVYGDTDRARVDEDAPTRPASPYGASKLAAEQAVRDAARAGLLDYVVLRYFNVAGADPAGRVGQSTPNATHLIKAACETALGRRPCLHIHGTDWGTPDGTGVRDFIHVTDLAAAHLKAVKRLEAGRGALTLNIGTGRGWSVREVAASVERITGRPLPTAAGPRRPGDLAAVVADPSRAMAELDWLPRYDLDAMVAHALRWERGRTSTPRSGRPTSGRFALEIAADA